MKQSFEECSIPGARARSLLGLILGCMAWVGGLVAASPPNLIVIFSDDVGYSDLACYGSDKVSSLHIDRLAGQGMRFTDFHVPANVCGPSRAALMTGRLPMRAGHPIFPSPLSPIRPPRDCTRGSDPGGAAAIGRVSHQDGRKVAPRLTRPVFQRPLILKADQQLDIYRKVL